MVLDECLRQEAEIVKYAKAGNREVRPATRALPTPYHSLGGRSPGQAADPAPQAEDTQRVGQVAAGQRVAPGSGLTTQDLDAHDAHDAQLMKSQATVAKSMQKSAQARLSCLLQRHVTFRRRWAP